MQKDEARREAMDPRSVAGLVLALFSLALGLHRWLHLSRVEFLMVFAMMGIFFVIIPVWTGFTELGTKMDEGVRELREIRRLLQVQRGSEEGSSEGREEAEVIKTSGVGAFSGMIIGGLIGLGFGPAGVLICGMIGAVIGDQIEREKVKGEKERLDRSNSSRGCDTVAGPRLL